MSRMWLRRTDARAKRILTNCSSLLHKVQSHSSASRWNLLQNLTWTLLEVPKRFRKRDDNGLSMTSSELEKNAVVSRSSGTGSQLDAPFWAYDCFPMVCYEEYGGGLMPNSLCEGRGAKSERWQ